MLLEKVRVLLRINHGRHLRLVMLPALLLSSVHPTPLAAAQTTAVANAHPAASAGSMGAAGSIFNAELSETPGQPPLINGWNASIAMGGTHDSQSGWLDYFQPALGFSFNRTFSIDVSIPIYLSRYAYNTQAVPRRNKPLVLQHLRGELGDTIIGLHAQTDLRPFSYMGTLSATAPTGDTTYGLSTGRPTFDLNNHFEHSFNFITPNVEIGVGDSAGLVDRRVLKDYTTLGPLAHFQLGTSFALPWDIAFEADAYEQMPIGDQKIYTTVRRNRKKETIVKGTSVSEDNGFLGSLDIPLSPHFSATTYYDRSLRFKVDTVGFSLNYALRGRHKNGNPDALMDDLLTR